jgi:hypothetical protein
MNLVIILAMTLSERNVFFKAGIAFCLIITLLAFALSILTIPVYSGMEENNRHPLYLFQAISGLFLQNNYYAVHTSLVMAVLFSFIGIALIHSFFERTSAPEILYISLFTISFSFEVIRLILPLNLINSFPLLYLLGASRLLLFARYFGLFSLFVASVCAAGLDVQKTRNIILVLIIAVLLITFSVPIDTLIWDTGFNMITGYPFLFKMIEVVLFITTVLTFFIAVKIRDSKEYVNVGIGAALALIGRNILIGSDNWAGNILGIVLLSFGTYFLCSKLHKIHLWL